MVTIKMSRDDQFASWPVSPLLVSRVETSVRNFRASDPFLPIHILVPNHVRRPAPRLPARAACCRAQRFSTPDYLKCAVEMPGFAPAALRTLRDTGERVRQLDVERQVSRVSEQHPVATLN
jgi:hypothetical protein